MPDQLCPITWSATNPFSHKYISTSLWFVVLTKPSACANTSFCGCEPLTCILLTSSISFFSIFFSGGFYSECYEVCFWQKIYKLHLTASSRPSRLKQLTSPLSWGDSPGSLVMRYVFETGSTTHSRPRLTAAWNASSGDWVLIVNMSKLTNCLNSWVVWNRKIGTQCVHVSSAS